MLIYWIVFAGFALAAIVHRDVQPQFAFEPRSGAGREPPLIRSISPELVALMLIVLIGLRYHVGGDWDNYDLVFVRLGHQNLMDVLTYSRNELGYAFLNWLAWQFNAKIWFVNVVCAVPFSWGLMRLSKDQPNPWLSLVVATPFLIVVVGMGFTRQAAALGFLMLAIASFVRTGRLAPFIFYCLLGALFHRTVLVFIPIILLVASRRGVISYLLAGLAIFLAYVTVFASAVDLYSAGYVNADYDSAGAAVRVLMNVLPAAILLSSGDRFYRSVQEKVVWKTFAQLALVSAVALPLVSSSVIVDRLGMYLIPIQLFVFGRIQFVGTQSTRPDLTWAFLVIMYSASVLIVWLNYGHYAAGWIPYRNFLTTPGSFNA